MTLFTGGGRARRGKTLEDFTTSTSYTLGEVAKEAWRRNPTSSIKSFWESTGLSDGTPISREDAEARVKESGTDVNIWQSGITEEKLDWLIEKRRAEMKMQDALARAPGGIGSATLRFGTSIAVSMLDPINIAASFIPVVGHARYARMVKAASSAWGRAGVRASVGAVEGVTGQLMVEPIVYAAAQQEQSDYGMADSILNVGMGAVFGPVFHVASGAAIDAGGVRPIHRLQVARENRFISRVATAEGGSPHTTRHQAGVGSLINDFARWSGIDDTTTEAWARSAKVHDRGKTLDPRIQELIDSPRKLTPDERKLVAAHTDIGADEIRAKAPGSMRDTAEIMARYHHERWDGKGTHGLKGTDIPVEARAVAITDVFEALTSPDRPYRAPAAWDEALMIMIGDDGHYDPDMLKTFVRGMLRDYGEGFAPENKARLLEFVGGQKTVDALPQRGLRGFETTRQTALREAERAVARGGERGAVPSDRIMNSAAYRAAGLNPKDHAAAMRIAIAQMSTGRQVDVEPFVKFREASGEIRPTTLTSARRQTFARLEPEFRAELEPVAARALPRVERQQLETQARQLEQRAETVEKTEFKTTAKRIQREEGVSRKQAEAKARKETVRVKNETEEKLGEVQEKLAADDEARAAKADLSRMDQNIVPERFRRRVDDAAKNLYEGGGRRSIGEAVRQALPHQVRAADDAWRGVKSGAESNFRPENSRLYNRHLDERITEKLDNASDDSLEAIQAEMSEELARVKELADTLGMDMEPVLRAANEGVEEADRMTKALRAFVLCNMRRSG